MSKQDRACLIECAKSMGGMVTLLLIIRRAYKELGAKDTEAVIGMIDAAIDHAEQSAAGSREAATILADRLNRARKMVDELYANIEAEGEVA